MRAPPESFRPMTGAPARIARSMILQIFSALVSESEPPKTVKSWAKTYTTRPLMRPKPVTKPSPAGRCSCMPKSTQRWRTNLSSSSKVPSSNKRWMRSRAVSLPALCSRSRRSGPPPASASSEMRRSSSIRSRRLASEIKPGLVSANWSSLGRGFLRGKNADGEMRSKPHCSQQQDDTEEYLCGHGAGALQGGFQRGHILRGLDENVHGPQGHRHDEDGGKNGSEDHFHGTESGPPRSGMEKDSATGEKAVRRSRSASSKETCSNAPKLSADRTNRRRRGWNRWDWRRRTSYWRAGPQRAVP